VDLILSSMLYIIILILVIICINQGDKIRRLKRELDEAYKSKESLRTGLSNNIEMLREQLSHYR
jgi:hypothetical protein